MRPLWAYFALTPDRSVPQVLSPLLDEAAGKGYTGVRFDLRWDRAQAKAPPGAVDVSSVEWAVRLARAKHLDVALGLDHSVAPGWIDTKEFGMRGPKGTAVISTRSGRPLLSLNAKQVCDWVAAFVTAVAAHYKDAVSFYEDLSQHLREDLEHRPGGGVLDHSPRCLEAYRAWLRVKYVDIRALNEAWESDYADWNKVEAGEGVRKSSQADFHLFRYSTLASWVAALSKAVKAGHPEADYAYRTPVEKMGSNLYRLAFDIGRYAKYADIVMCEEAVDPFVIAMIRTACEVSGARWGVEATPTGAAKAGPEEGADKDLVKWGLGIYRLGGFLSVQQPLVEDAGKTLEEEIVKVLEMPQPQPLNNRHAIYVSAAEIQFWDGTDCEQARNMWIAATDSGKKTGVDVISDGIFAGAPDVLRRYTAGITIPFGRVIAKEARTALIQAQKSGIRLVFQFPDKAGIEDEHGQRQDPLAG